MNLIKFYEDDMAIYGFLSRNYQKNIEYCARTCYAVEDRITEDSWYNYIKARVVSGHESVIEHNMMTFLFVSPHKAENNEFISKLENLVLEANNLIVPTRYYAKDDNELDYLLLTGNIRMYRDMLKKFNKNPEYSNYYELLYFSFVELLEPSRGIFTIDIPNCETKDRDVISHDIEPTDIKLKNVNTGDKNILLDIINIDDITGIYHLIDDNHKHIVTDNIIKICGITYRIKTPRVISQQDARHRIQAMSQKSQRYVNESKYDAENIIYKPSYIDCNKKYNIKLSENVNAEISYSDFAKLSLELYKQMQNDNIKNEVARFVLLNGIYTEYCLTKPLFTLSHYFDERLSVASQYEIRLVAAALCTYVNIYLGKELSNIGVDKKYIFYC